MIGTDEKARYVALAADAVPDSWNWHPVAILQRITNKSSHLSRKASVNAKLEDHTELRPTLIFDAFCEFCFGSHVLNLVSFL